MRTVAVCIVFPLCWIERRAAFMVSIVITKPDGLRIVRVHWKVSVWHRCQCHSHRCVAQPKPFCRRYQISRAEIKHFTRREQTAQQHTILFGLIFIGHSKKLVNFNSTFFSRSFLILISFPFFHKKNWLIQIQFNQWKIGWNNKTNWMNFYSKFVTHTHQHQHTDEAKKTKSTF